ncbi:MAG: sigma-70 family RNA polymerase sigma factor [Acidimicrobiales bacterium]|jgi:RNA polymerase sigma-70 factor (ECF subfamily)
MDERPWLATKFEEYRPRLTAVASRMLGSRIEADDAVQEAWIRFSRSDTSGVENLEAWLTTVVSRVCLNTLQSRRARWSLPLNDVCDTSFEDTGSDPEREALLADSVGLALLIVLDSLTPTERVAFVLHDMFAVSFEDIAPIVGRNAAATRQLASRARRRVQHPDAEHGRDRLQQARLVDAFLAAARRGDFSALVELLDPDAVLRCDSAAVAIGGPEQARGAEAVAAFSKRARGARPALLDGIPAAVWMPRGQLRVALLFTFSAETIAVIEAVAEPARLATLDLVVVGDAWS